MKNISYLFVLFIWAYAVIACQPKTQHLKNMKELDKTDIIALYEKHSGESIKDPNDFCTEKANSFKGVVSLGWFAHDRGCMGDEILVGTEIGKREDMTVKALELNGWKEKDKQQDLALNWSKEVILSWESALDSSNEDCELASTPTFEAPKSVKNGTGWQVTLWVQRPSGMIPQTSYYQLQIDFEASGKVSTQKKVNSFVVKM